MTDPSESSPPPQRPPRIRPKRGAWSPLVDMTDVFPGHRGRSRDDDFGLFDAPSGIRFEVEMASKSVPLLEATEPWERDSISPLFVWQDGGRYHMLYDAAAGQCYAVSDDACEWTRPSLGEVDFEGSKDNNLIAQPCAGATGVFEDPSAPPAERFKAMADMGINAFGGCCGTTPDHIRALRDAVRDDGLAG